MKNLLESLIEKLKKSKKPYIDKDIKPYIDKDIKSDIKKGTKPDTKKDTKPDINIGKKTSFEMFKVVKFKFKNKINWEKKVITQVFWKSHISELCEKWTYNNNNNNNNYAYTRFEEFRTCSGEVLFTNEHKAVFSKNKAKTYIDIDDLKISKDFSKEDKTKLKKTPKSEIETITTETIKIITAKKDENIKDNYLAKIKEYTCMISDIYDSLQNPKEKLTDKIIMLQNATSELKYAKYQNNLLLKSEILEKVDVVLSD